MNPTSIQHVCNKSGWLTQYFLRRLARAHSDSKGDVSASYSSALFEVTLVAVVAPCIAVYSCILITSIKWAPLVGSWGAGSSPKLTALIIGCIALVAGGYWFNCRFRKYRGNPATWTDFDTEEDRRLIFWQKLVILSICGLVVPLLALATTLWAL